MRDVMNLKKIKRMRSAKNGIGIAALFFILLLAAVNVAIADDPDYYASATYGWDKANITVTINQKTIIDVTPEVMDFGNVDPGNVVSQYNVTDGTNNVVQLSQFEIENLGSTNITKVWLNVTQPSSNPFGTGQYSLYDPANWIAVRVDWIKTSSNTPSYTDTISYIDRKEFNESKELVYLNLPTNTKSYGRFRNANKEYFWAVTSTGANCDASTNTVNLYLGNPNEPHNVTNTGDINLVDGDEVTVSYSGTQAYNGITYSLPTAATSYNGEEYVFLVATDCSHIRAVKWNADAPGTDKLSNYGYVFNTTDSTQGLLPGQGIALSIEMRVPYGVVAHSYEGWMTVVASSA